MGERPAMISGSSGLADDVIHQKSAVLDAVLWDTQSYTVYRIDQKQKRKHYVEVAFQDTTIRKLGTCYQA